MGVPYPNYPKEFHELIHFINHKILDINNEDERYQKFLWEYENWNIDKLDIKKTALYIQYIFGRERFGDGFIEQHMKNGILLQLIKHLKQELDKELNYKLSDEQIRQIANAIDPKEVLDYVDSHREEYEEFLKQENLQESDN